MPDGTSVTSDALRRRCRALRVPRVRRHLATGRDRAVRRRIPGVGADHVDAGAASGASPRQPLRRASVPYERRRRDFGRRIRRERVDRPFAPDRRGRPAHDRAGRPTLCHDHPRARTTSRRTPRSCAHSLGTTDSKWQVNPPPVPACMPSWTSRVRRPSATVRHSSSADARLRAPFTTLFGRVLRDGVAMYDEREARKRRDVRVTRSTLDTTRQMRW